MFGQQARAAVDRELETIWAGVAELLPSLHLPPPPGFRESVRKELAPVPTVNLAAASMRLDELNALYELRSQLLDWMTETGFLGYFDANAGRRYIYRRRLEVFLRLLPDLHGKRVLELGSAAGVLASLLAPRAREVIGIDIAATATSFARNLARALHRFNTRFFVGDAHHLAFPNAAFDVVVSTEVLEHLLHPEDALRELHRILKPDGTLVLTTTTAPNPSDMVVKLIRLWKKDFFVDTVEQFDKKTYFAARAKGLRKPPEAFRRVHHRFGYAQLTSLFKKTGFALERARGAVVAFPPVYLGVYPFLPRVVLPVVRELEELLNELGVFKRFGSVTTAFALRRT